MKYITRNLEHVVQQVSTEYPVVLVTSCQTSGQNDNVKKIDGGNESRLCYP